MCSSPRSVAVIGASRDPARIGSLVLHNLRAGGFTRVALRRAPVGGRSSRAFACHRRVADIAGDVELAVIAVPADAVLNVVDDCIAKGVQALVVITAGFGETGAEGRARQRRLLEKVRAAGIRLVGPNCIGVLDTDPAVRLDATFAPTFPPARERGNVAIATQSGALGLSLLDYTARLGLGISSFVSLGNKADVSSNDLIQYWADDPRTDVIALYLESFGNPRTFGRLARRIGAGEADRGDEGGPLAGGHARRFVAHRRARHQRRGRRRAVPSGGRGAHALARGALRRDGAAWRCSRCRAGKRVAIVTNAGGPGILAADACEAEGLALAAARGSHGRRRCARSCRRRRAWPTRST